MSARRPVRLLVVVMAAALSVVVGVWLFLSGQRQAEVEVRYVELRRVMRSGDMDGFRALLVPGARANAGECFSRMDGFAKDLEPGSDISVWGDRASVTPRVDTDWVLIKIGHGVNLERVDGEWYFTGRISIN